MQTRHSLVNRIFIIIILFFSSIAIAIGYWAWDNVKNERYANLESTALFLNSYYELSFYQRELGLRSIGERMLSIKGVDQVQQRLDVALGALNVHNEFLAIGLVDTTGQLITFTGALEQKNLPNLANSEKTRRTFEQVKRADGLVIGEVYYFDEISNWILPIRVPIRNTKGELVAVNTSAISVIKLMDELISFNINSTYRIHLVNGTFKTTQLYFPLEQDQFISVLHQPAEILKNVKKVMQKEPTEFIEGEDIRGGQHVIGVRTRVNKQDHYIEVFVDQEVLWESYKESLFLIIGGYSFLMLTLTIIFIYLRTRVTAYEQELSIERDYSNRIIQSTSALIVGIGVDQLCTFMNAAAERATGYSKSEIIGKNWWTTMYPGESYEQVDKLFHELPDGNVTNHEMQFVTKQGNTRNVSWNSIRLYDRRGALTEIIGLGIDVTEQKEAERGLRERRANLKSIVESTNNSIALVDTKLRILDFNQAFRVYCKQVIGIEVKRGMSVDALVEGPDTEILIEYLKKALKGEKLSKLVDYNSKSGAMYLSINFNPVYQGNEVTGVSMFLQDLTELKKAQDELKRYSENLEVMVEERSLKISQTNNELQLANEELKLAFEELNKTQDHLIQAEKMASLGVLSAGVGHEINNPLNFIKGGVNALASQIKKTSEKNYEEATPFIDIINEGVNRATAIVKGLSHFSRETTEQNEKCDIHQILDNCLLILNSRLKHRVVIEKEYHQAPIILIGNEGKLHQALLNILSNAEQAILEKGTIRIVTSLDVNAIRISIADTGIGIAKENLKRVSDPFFTTKEPGKGTGLGLSITYKIINDHNGKILVTSDLDKGTEFVILFPSNSLSL